MLSNRSWIRAGAALIASLLLCFAFSMVFAPGAAHARQSLDSPIQLTCASSESDSKARVEDGIYIISSAAKARAVLEVEDGVSGADAKIQAWSATGTPNQRWRITRLSDGFYKIVNVDTGKALGVAKAKVSSGTAVKQSAWKATKAQKWKFMKNSAGYSLVSALSSKYSMSFSHGETAEGTPAAMYRTRAAKAYRLSLKRIKPILDDGTYTFACAASGKKLAVAGANVDNCANVQQGGKKATLASTFELKFDEKTGYYRILAVASGLAVDVAGAEDADCANIRLYTSTGTRAQRWAIAKNADGTFTFRSAMGGRVLDVEGASVSTGANVQLYSSNGTDAQKWKVKAVKNWLPDGTYTFASSLNTSRMMGVKSSSKAVGANVRTANRTFAKSQKWTIKYNKEKRAYTIRNKNSKLMLEAAASARDGANVRQAKASGKKTQLWIPIIGAGGVRFASAANPDVVLGVAGASKSAGANILVSADKQKGFQKFRLRDATLPMFKVYLNPGHGWNSNNNGVWDPGASGSGYDEADFTHDLARRVQGYCESYGIEVVNGEQFQLAYWKRLPKAVELGCDAIVSIHFDWSGAGVSGTHTMVGVQGKAAGSDLLNDIIHRHLVAATGLPDLGTFSRSDITAVNGSIPSMLMEVCFMDNAYNVSTYLSRRDKVARAIADGILEASQQPSLSR